MRGRRFYVITGISGAGKSQALKIFEDFGFYCVDNLPFALIDGFAGLWMRSTKHKDVALGIDIRAGELEGFAETLKGLRDNGLDVKVLFLDATDDVVVARFSETRHRHPLGRDILRAVQEERRVLYDLKSMANRVIDTSSLTLGELKEQISRALETKRTHEMDITVTSFGYKHGLPMDADLVMDVRFLTNPNYVKQLKKKTGLQKAVRSHILKQRSAKPFLKRYAALIRSLLPHYVREGKSYLTLAVGCTGGRHRSVFVAHHLAGALQKRGYKVREYHRDISR